MSRLFVRLLAVSAILAVPFGAQALVSVPGDEAASAQHGQIAEVAAVERESEAGGQVEPSGFDRETEEAGLLQEKTSNATVTGCCWFYYQGRYWCVPCGS